MLGYRLVQQRAFGVAWVVEFGFCGDWHEGRVRVALPSRSKLGSCRRRRTVSSQSRASWARVCSLAVARSAVFLRFASSNWLGSIRLEAGSKAKRSVLPSPWRALRMRPMRS